MDTQKLKKVLIVNEKHRTRVFDISTVEQREKAFLHLFKDRCQIHGFYSTLVEMKSTLFNEASKGNTKSAEAIILFRSANGYEYEEVKELEIEEI